jgi:hypothetical protein
VSFDPFSNDNMGIVTWFDGNELNQRSMWIRYSTSANRYIANSSINSPFITNAHVFGAEANLLRSSVVANTISATAHFAFVRQTAGWQQRYRYLPSSSSTDHINNWGPPVRLDIYTGSAANTVLIETAYLRQGFLY